MLPDKLSQIKDQLYTKNEYGVDYQRTDVKLSEKDIDYLHTEFGIKKDLHNMCVNCQARQIIKYYDQEHKGREKNKFQVPCTGVPKQISINKHALDEFLTENETSKEKALNYFKATQDPVAWCNLMFSFDETNPEWRIRPHQKEMLRCNSLRSVERWGRRAGKTMGAALKILYLVFTKTYSQGTNTKGQEMLSGPKVMVVTPYQSQLTNFFNELEALLKRNADLVNQVTTGTGGSLYTKSPHFKMEFSNGGKIEGFVSGVGNKADGSGGGTIRGFSADVIYIDEMDMVPEDILDKVVLPILLTRPQVALIATSTPIGKRSKFYKYCKEDPIYKENHFPSTVLPHWANIKTEIEQDFTKDAFDSEFMALFLEGGHGVFKPELVHASRQDYSYEETENPAWWVHQAGILEPQKMSKCIGIDWNKNAGSEFAVVAYDSVKNKWITVETTNVSASEFSSVAWKQEVLRLNYKHKPDFIYADEGYGHTIIEDLKLLALDTAVKKHKSPIDVETAKIMDRLVAFNFSSKVTLRNPLDNKEFEKTGKDFLVENLVRILEDRNFWFSVDDNVLLKQMLSYVVLKRGATGRAIYGPEDAKLGDHRLDAIMLAVGGLVLEFGIYSVRSGASSLPSFLDKNIVARDKIDSPTALDLLKKNLSDPDSNGWRSFMANQNELLESLGNHLPKEPERNRSRTQKTEKDLFSYLGEAHKLAGSGNPNYNGMVISAPGVTSRRRRSEIRKGR